MCYMTCALVVDTDEIKVVLLGIRVRTDRSRQHILGMAKVEVIIGTLLQKASM